MLQRLFDTKNGLDVAFFVLRWILLIGFSVVLVLVHNPALNTETSQMDHLIVAAGIGAVATLIYGVMIAIKDLRPYAIYAQVAGDLLIAGAFVLASIETRPPESMGLPYYEDAGVMLLVTGVLTTMMITGVLRLGAASATIYGAGILGAAAAATTLSTSFVFEAVIDNPLPYLPPIVFVVLVGLITGIWSNGFSEDNSVKRNQLLDEYDKMEQRVDKMQERVRLLSEMTTRLNSTLNFQSILESTANLGRMTVRSGRNTRTVSMVLLIEDENLLTVAASSGIRDEDMRRRFQGEEGLVARALDLSDPILAGYQELRNDPELKYVVALRDIQSALFIPLRAGLDIYGVVIIGTTQKDAFDSDSLETLKAIGVQATMAMQNAMLYTGLQDEKDRLVEIEENARKALVRDLHDVPTQTMSAVAMQLSIIPMIAESNPDTLRGEVENIRQMSLRAVDEIRHVMFTLRPLSLENHGLGAALEELKRKIEGTFRQPLSLEYDPYADLLLDKNKQGTVFYLVEEATNNARKYAEASMIRILFRVAHGELVVRISDNGKGFDASNARDNSMNKGSFGMVNMHERAGQVGGTLDIQSKKGKGTTITVRIPVNTDRIPAPSSRNGKSKFDTTPRKKSIRDTQSNPQLVMANRGPLSPGS